MNHVYTHVDEAYMKILYLAAMFILYDLTFKIHSSKSTYYPQVLHACSLILHVSVLM